MSVYPQRRFSFTFIIVLLSVFVWADFACAQAEIELSNRDVPIPHGYKSWSLFLVNNPEWILPEKKENLDTLFEQFKAFGDAIGPDHLAVWFWEGKSRNPWKSKPDDIKNVDFERSSAICAKLKLPASKSPYIIITTEYPGEALLDKYPETFDTLQNYSVVELNNLSAKEITKVLSNIADQLLTEKISEIKTDTENYWFSWQKTYEALRDNLVNLTKKISISINTSFLKFEIKEDK